MECDVCGKREASFIIQIEGAKVAACKGCAYHGKIIISLDDDGAAAPVREFKSQIGRGVPRSLQMEEDLVEDYGKIVRKAREARGLKIDEFARGINEMASYIDKIENERTRPPIETAKKLEKALKVRILEKVDNSSAPVQLGAGKTKELSLLDMLEMQNKKKGK